MKILKACKSTLTINVNSLFWYTKIFFRYPPQGERSWGPARATALADTKEANAAVKVNINP